MSESRFCWDGCKQTQPVFMTAIGIRVCSYCGTKFPTEFKRADKIEEHETRINYIQRRVKALEDRLDTA